RVPIAMRRFYERSLWITQSYFVPESRLSPRAAKEARRLKPERQPSAPVVSSSSSWNSNSSPQLPAGCQRSSAVSPPPLPDLGWQSSRPKRGERLPDQFPPAPCVSVCHVRIACARKSPPVSPWSP